MHPVLRHEDLRTRKGGEFPQRFCFKPRCIVWPLDEVLEWTDAHGREHREGCGPHPDYRTRSGNGMSDGQ